MGELIELNKKAGQATSIAYEYVINEDKFIWKGSIKEVFGSKTESQLDSKENFSAIINEEDRKNYTKSFNKALSDNTSLDIAYTIRLFDGKIVQATDLATIIDGENGKTLLGVISFREASEEDILGLYNNRGLLEELSKSISNSKQENTTGCLLKVCVENLPTFICWHSKDATDRILEEVKEEIQKIAGEDSVVERINIEEFGIILEDTSKDEVLQIINKIHYFINSFRSPDVEEHLRFDCHIGSAYFPEDVSDADSLMSRAYIALCSAKESVSSFYADYDDAENEKQFSKEQIKIMYYMKDAVNQDKFLLAYQPIVESRTGNVASYECLLRVKDDEGKISTAWPIIHVAEKTGFIDVVDNFVLDHVVSDLKSNDDIQLTFNVSNITTDSPKWLAKCTKYFSDPEIASRVTVEITETAAERDLKQTAYFVASLQALGCKVALDDFGAGYTSFRQLKSLSVDMVKIDGMFILDLAENSENLLFIKTLLDFNNCYGLQTIAECVESGEVAKLLMDLNVDYMQGYYFGVPNIDPSWKQNSKDS